MVTSVNRAEMSTDSFVSIIIPVYNGAATIGQTVASILSSTHTQYEIIVIDDASSDNTADILGVYPVTVIRNSRRRGPAAARNVGIEHSCGDVLFFVDADVVIDAHLLASMLELLHSEPDIVGVGSFSSLEPANPCFYSRYYAIQEFAWLTHGFHGKTRKKVPLVCTRCGLLKRHLLEKIGGGFNESLSYPSMEDWELSMRLKTIFLISWDFGLTHVHHFPNSFFSIIKRNFFNTYLFVQLQTPTGITPGPHTRTILTRALLGIFFLFCIAGCLFPALLVVAFLVHLLAIISQKRLLSLFFYHMGFVSGTAGWALYCFLTLPIFCGFVVGMMFHIITLLHFFFLPAWRLFLILPQQIGLGARLLRGMFLSNHPCYLILFVTLRCNCKCSMCFHNMTVHHAKHGELSLELLRTIATSLRPLPQLLLSGGEPFLRRDIDRIVTLFYKHAGTRQFSIATNGTLPEHILASVEAMLLECPNAFININISVDGIGGDHNRLRGMDGCFEKLCETYQLLEQLRFTERRLSLNILTVIGKENAEKLNDIIRYVKTHFNANFHAIEYSRGEGDMIADAHLRKNTDERLRLFHEQGEGFSSLPAWLRIVSPASRLLWEVKLQTRDLNRRCFHCLAGRKMIVISNDGLLWPCEPLWLDSNSLNRRHQSDFLMARLSEYGFHATNALGSEQSKKVIAQIDRKECYCCHGCAVYNSLIYCPWSYSGFLLKLLKKSLS